MKMLKTKFGFLLGLLCLVFLIAAALPFMPSKSYITPETATIEVAEKMGSISSIMNRGRSPGQEIRLMLSRFAEIAAEEPSERRLAARWDVFSKTKYAQNRQIVVRPAEKRGRDIVVPIQYAGGREKAEFIFSSKSTGGYAPRVRILESQPEIFRAAQTPVQPRLSAPLREPARSEVRASILYTHDPRESRYSQKEAVSLAPFGIKQFLSPFEISAMKAFLYRSYKEQPLLDDRRYQEGTFKRFNGELSKAEADGFYQVLYEIQENVRRTTGKKFDRDGIVNAMKEIYQKEVSGFDKRVLKKTPRAAAIQKERIIWPQIFEDLLKAVMADRSAQSPFIPAGLIELHGKQYVQVIPGTHMTLRFVKGGFPKQGISLLLGSGQHEVVARVENDVITFHYKQAPSQDRTFDQINKFGILSGHVGIGSAPQIARPGGKLITLPKADDIATRHAIFAVKKEGDIISVIATDGYFTGVAETRGYSGQMTLVEYPVSDIVYLPHERSEMRSLESLENVRSGAGETASPVGLANLREAVFAPNAPARIDRLTKDLRVAGLTQGLDPNLQQADRYAAEIRGGSLTNALNSVSKDFPVMISSNDPGALIFATANVPSREEFAAWQLLLASQRMQFYRVVLPQGLISAEEWKRLKDLQQQVFAEEKFGKRFDLVQARTSAELPKIRQALYNAMRQAGITQIKNTGELSEKFLVQWLDQNLPASFNAEDERDPLFAKIMDSDIGQERTYSELMIWGLAHAMKISQGIEAQKLKQEVTAIIQNGRGIKYSVTDGLRSIAGRFFAALQAAARIAQAA